MRLVAYTFALLGVEWEEGGKQREGSENKNARIQDCKKTS